MRELWNNFVADESGQGLTEYVLIIGLVSIAAILILAAFGGYIAGWFTEAADTMDASGIAPETPSGALQ
jgi:pilus assembly protein Flp/PilA